MDASPESSVIWAFLVETDFLRPSDFVLLLKALLFKLLLPSQIKK